MRHLPFKTHRKLGALSKAFAISLRSDPDLKPFIKGDLGGFRADLVREIKGLFPIPRGRRKHPRLDEANRLMRRGKSAAEVLRVQIPDFDEHDEYERYLMRKGLYQAVGRRRNKKSSEKPAEKPTPILPPETTS